MSRNANISQTLDATAEKSEIAHTPSRKMKFQSPKQNYNPKVDKDARRLDVSKLYLRNSNSSRKGWVTGLLGSSASKKSANASASAKMPAQSPSKAKTPAKPITSFQAQQRASISYQPRSPASPAARTSAKSKPIQPYSSKRSSDTATQSKSNLKVAATAKDQDCASPSANAAAAPAKAVNEKEVQFAK